MNLEWDAIRVFLMVAERASFSRAARELGISQPTVSRRVDDLEQALGVRLLVRRARGALPTPAGEQLLVQARRMADGASAAGRISTHDHAPRRIRISATEGIGTLWLPHQLAALGGANVELVIDNAASDLAAREADIAIRLFRNKQPNLVVQRVGTLDFGLFATRAYLARRGTPRRLDDLAAHDHVGFLDRGGPTPSYMRWLRELVPSDRFVVSASSLLAMYELARADAGLVLGTTAWLATDRTLVRVLPRARPPTMGIWLAVHADVRRDSEIGRVTEALSARLAAIATS